jgi:tetratricopeptide (TPR) repeat protein
MKTLRLLFIVLFSMLCGALLIADEREAAKIIQAAALNDQGDFRAAILLLESLLQPNVHAMNLGETGAAWNLLGNAYQHLGEYEKARRSFEAAIKVLKDSPGHIRQYAAALDNLGSLELEQGQPESSMTLRQKAKQLYESVGDHLGVARVANNLSLIAVQQGHYQDARRFLAEGFHEVSLASETDIDDLAALHSLQCVILAHDRDWHGALVAIQDAIDLWEHRHGSEYFLLASAYIVRGQIYDKLGEYQKAENDLQNALAQLEKTPGINSPLYLAAEVAYARVLRDSGSKHEASRLEDKARASLAELRRRQCTGCSVSVLGFP